MLIELHISTIIAAVIIPIVHILLIRFTQMVTGAVTLMFVTFFIYLIIVTTVYTKASLGPEAIGPMALALTICLVYMELFSMLCRGFSLALITTLYQNGPTKVEDIHNLYGSGNGIEWMLTKRLDSIEKIGLVRRNGDTICVNTVHGRLIGRATLKFKELLKIGPGGV